MTKQIPDRVLHNGQEYTLAGLKGSGLFTPIGFGISSEMVSLATVCYRGYFCKYESSDNALFLVELGIVQQNNVELPAIRGVSAKSDKVLFHCYESLRIRCPFTGGLILVKNPVEQVGHFPSPFKFEEVIELLFEKGNLQDEINHSLSVADIRKQVDQFIETLKSNSELSEVLRKWNSADEKVSDLETRVFHEYMHKIVARTKELEWSFVSGYEKQPTILITLHI